MDKNYEVGIKEALWKKAYLNTLYIKSLMSNKTQRKWVDKTLLD